MESYIDVCKKRREKGYNSPDQLAKAIFHANPKPIKTIRGCITKPDTLGNKIRELENGKTKWWKKIENEDALKRLADALGVKPDQIPLHEVPKQIRKYFNWKSELPDAKPFSSSEEPAKTGLEFDLLRRGQKIWYFIPHGWGKKFLTYFYQHKFNWPCFYNFESFFKAKLSFTQPVILCLDKWESLRKKEFAFRQFHGFVFASFVPPEGIADIWEYVLPFHPTQDWRSNFICWMYQRLPKSLHNQPEQIVALLEQFDREEKQFDTPKSLLPLIKIFHSDGIKGVKKSLQEGSFSYEILRNKLKPDDKLAKVFNDACASLITDTRYLLNQGWTLSEWTEILNKGLTQKDCRKIRKWLDMLQKSNVLVVMEDGRLKIAENCISGLAKQAFAKILEKKDISFGQLALDPSRRSYLDMALDMVVDVQWDLLLKTVIKRFDKHCLWRVAEIETLFSAIARRLRQNSIVDDEKTLYKEIFQLQMMVIQSTNRNFPPIAITRQKSLESIYETRWLLDCLLWDMTEVICEDMIPSEAKNLFPIHGKPSISEWTKFTELATRELEYYYNLSFANNREAYLWTDRFTIAEIKECRELLELAHPLINKLKITLEQLRHHEHSYWTLLFPAWYVHQLDKGQRPDIQPFLQKHLCCNEIPPKHGWKYHFVELLEKRLSHKIQEIAAEFFLDCMICFAQYPKERIQHDFVNFCKQASAFWSFWERHVKQPPSCEIKSLCSILDLQQENLEILPLWWQRWFLDNLIKTTEGINSLAEYISAQEYSCEISVLCKQMKMEHWATIINKLQKSNRLGFYSLIWSLTPNFALQQAEIELQKNSKYAEHWFCQAPMSWTTELCNLIIETKKNKKLNGATWCSAWFIRRLTNPAIYHSLAKLYSLICLE